jgi:hypothetical protein
LRSKYCSLTAKAADLFSYRKLSAKSQKSKDECSMVALANCCKIKLTKLQHWFYCGMILAFLCGAGQFFVSRVNIYQFRVSFAGSPMILLSISVLGLRTDITRRRFAMADLGNFGIALCCPSHKYMDLSVIFKLTGHIDDTRGAVIQKIIIPCLQNLRRLVPSGLCIRIF